MLRHEDGCALHRVCATGLAAHDRARDVWKDLDGGKRGRVKDACLVVVPCPCELEKGAQEYGRLKLTNEYATAREDMKEGIEIVWVCPLKPVEEERCTTTRNAGENLKRRVGRSVCARLAAHD